MEKKNVEQHKQRGSSKFSLIGAAVRAILIAFLVFSPSVSFAAPENITANQNYGTNGDPVNEGAVFAGFYTYSIGDGDNLGQTGTISIYSGAVSPRGTINFAGDSVLQGSIGKIAGGLEAINCNGAAGKTVQVSAAAGTKSYITTVTIAGTGTLDLDGMLQGWNLNYTADGTVTIADTKDINIAIRTGTSGEGTLTVEGTSIITGQVGTNANRLKAVNSGATGDVATFTNDVFADTTTVSGTGTLNLDGSLTGTTLNFAADGTATLADTKNITAATTTATNDTGTLTIQGTSTVAGQVGTGAKGLKAVNAGAVGDIATFANDVFATYDNSFGERYISPRWQPDRHHASLYR